MRLLAALSLSLLIGCTEPDDTSDARARASYDLKDPSSAQFRELNVWRNKAGETVCVSGEINGKNSLGAYSGFRKFFVIYPSNKVVAEPEATTFLTDVDKLQYEYDKIKVMSAQADCQGASAR